MRWRRSRPTTAVISLFHFRLAAWTDACTMIGQRTHEHQQQHQRHQPQTFIQLNPNPMKTNSWPKKWTQLVFIITGTPSMYIHVLRNRTRGSDKNCNTDDSMNDSTRSSIGWSGWLCSLKRKSPISSIHPAHIILLSRLEGASTFSLACLSWDILLWIALRAH
jgi:hypothetical protein